MRPEVLYLTDIVDAADAVRRFVEGVRRQDFFGDEMRQSAVLQKLIVIGEAVARLPPAFREGHPEVEWADVVGFRIVAAPGTDPIDSNMERWSKSRRSAASGMRG